MPGSANQMLSAVLPANRRHLLDVAREVTRSSEAWLSEYSIVKRPSVTAACGLLAAVAMPRLATPELDLLTRWELWLVAVDDVLDDLALPDEPVAAWVQRFLRDLPADPGDADRLRAALGSIHRDLGRYPLYPALGARWRAGMTSIVRGMLLERAWSRAPLTRQPGYAAYLRNATTTIGVLPGTVTAAILAGEPAAIGEFSALEPMIRAAARCFRLANDLGSDARERAEGKLNAVSLLQRDYLARGLRDDDAARAARERLRQMGAADLAYLDSAQRTAPAALAALARSLWSQTSFLWNMYQMGDCDALSAVLLQEFTHVTGGNIDTEPHRVPVRGGGRVGAGGVRFWRPQPYPPIRLINPAAQSRELLCTTRTVTRQLFWGWPGGPARGPGAGGAVRAGGGD